MIINKNKLQDFFVMIFFIFPFIKPEYLIVTYPFLSKLYLILEIFVIIVSLVIYAKYKTISKIIIYIFIYFIILLFPTLLYNYSNLDNYFKMFFSTIGLCLVCDLGLRFKTKPFIYAFCTILSIYIFINLITIFLFPNGMYIGVGSGYLENWFLGYRNIHILYIFPFIIFSICLSYYKYNKITFISYMLVFICILSLIIAKSSTSIVGLILIVIYIIFENKVSNAIFMNLKTYVISYILLFFSIIIFRIQEIFKFFIVDILKKDITFTNRIFIWDDVLMFIKNKPLLGYGYELGITRYFKSINYRSYHAHNQVLEVIYKSGFIGLLSFCTIIISIIKKLYNYKSTKIGKFLSYSLFTFFIMTLTEAYSYEYFMYLFVLFYNVDKLLFVDERNVKNEI